MLRIMESFECDTCGVVQTVDPREFKGDQPVPGRPGEFFTPSCEAILEANYEWRIALKIRQYTYSTNPHYLAGAHYCPVCKQG